MPNREFTLFKVGQKVRILDDRRDWYQTDGELEIAAVHDHGFKRGVGHPQSLTMTDGQTFSAWWFDPKTKCLWEPCRERPKPAADADHAQDEPKFHGRT